MLTERFVAASLSSEIVKAPTNSTLKDVGIFLHEYKPQSTFRHGYKKTSARRNCVAVSKSHIFAAQADKAVVNVYSREKGNQEATVPFPERVHSLAYVGQAGILIIGTDGGKIMSWEVATGRLTISAASHLQAVTSLCVTTDDAVILSGSADSSVHIWSLLNLVTFSQPSSNSESRVSRSPLRTFSNHRKPISALRSSHSKSSTNFAVSASTDQTCYIWRISDCQVLRTVLLPAVALSFALDPADRAIYIGYENGHIHALNLFKPTGATSRVDSTYNETNSAPIQLDMENSWTVPTATTGQANCLTLSYDGTCLLSGHDNGKVLSWDVAKGRFLKDVADFGYPVTNLHMIRPDGFLNEQKETFEITGVVKPRLELNAVTDNGTCGIPAAYTISVKLNGLKIDPVEGDDISQAMNSPYFTKDLLNEALQSLVPGASKVNFSTNVNPATDINLARTERLEDKVQELNDKIAELNKHITKIQKVRQSKSSKSNQPKSQKVKNHVVDKNNAGRTGRPVEDEDAEVDDDDDGEDEDENGGEGEDEQMTG